VLIKTVWIIFLFVKLLFLKPINAYFQSVNKLLSIFLCSVFLCLFQITPSQATNVIEISPNEDALDISAIWDLQTTSRNVIAINAAPQPDGSILNFETRAQEIEGKAEYHWGVFALTNTTDSQIERLIVTPRFRLVGSGIWNPDLGSPRIANISTDRGFPPELVKSSEDDVFQVTLDPGSTITFVLELETPELAKLVLWNPDVYKDRVNSFSLYRGIIIGIAGLLAVFLSIIFVVKGSSIIPAAAILAWSILMYVSIDFGFWFEVTQLPASTAPIFRAMAEALLAGALSILLFAYLNLSVLHVRAIYGSILWAAMVLSIIAASIWQPQIAAGLSRIILLITCVFGFALIIYYASKKYERAIMLIPSWIVFSLWVCAMTATLIGSIDNDFVAPALSGGLTLFVLLIGFTIVQYTFASNSSSGGLSSDSDRRILALSGSGAHIWDWDVERDHVYISPECERNMKLPRSKLIGHARNWLKLTHVEDKDRLRETLDAILEHARGRIDDIFRIRSNEGLYISLHLKARPVISNDGTVIRCVGTIEDISARIHNQEMILQNAIIDNVTGLPRQAILEDRLNLAIDSTPAENTQRPAAIIVDIDNFNKLNKKHGLSVSDIVLLTLARRLQRLISEPDIICRLDKDQFIIALISPRPPGDIALLSDSLRRSISQPVSFGTAQIQLSACIGVAVHDGLATNAKDLIQDTHLALQHAKRQGIGQISAFKPSLRHSFKLQNDLVEQFETAFRAEKIEIKLRPYYSLKQNLITGFQAHIHWPHPVYSNKTHEELYELADKANLNDELIDFLARSCAKIASEFTEIATAPSQFHISFPLPSIDVLNAQLVNDFNQIMDHNRIHSGALEVQVKTAWLAQSPEKCQIFFNRIQSAGFAVCLTEFGEGSILLDQLEFLPIHAIQFSEDFIASKSNRKSSTLLSSLSLIGHHLKAELRASNVTNASILPTLKKMKFSKVSGEYFSDFVAEELAKRILMKQTSKVKQKQKPAPKQKNQKPIEVNTAVSEKSQIKEKLTAQINEVGKSANQKLAEIQKKKQENEAAENFSKPEKRLTLNKISELPSFEDNFNTQKPSE